LVLCAAGLGAVWAVRQPERPGPLAAARDIVIPPGGSEAVAATLRREGVIHHERVFLALAWLTRAQGQLRAAEFAFPQASTLTQVLAILRTARPVEHRVTIPEGVTASRAREILDRLTTASGEAGAITEGDMLPNTYRFERGTPRAEIVRRAREAMTRLVETVWAERAPDLPLRSPAELVVLASIVERETGREEERARVAGVFVNRLRRDMRLQSDPTVIFAVSDGLGTLDRKLTRADLDRDHPYNTYRRTGLPPGPIAMPGAASLRAVANPARGDDLYFVADGQGGHAFAKTLDAHNRNVARWRERNQP
jgi:UPF0755 protein